MVIAHTDKWTSAFEGTLVSRLRSISNWLLLAASLSSSESESSSESGIHSSFPRLFAVCHLPSVMYAFLSHTLGAGRDWVVHSEIYVDLMNVIKHLASSPSSSSGGSGLSGAVKEPVRRVEESCGMQAWMWYRGEVVWVRGAEGDVGQGREGRSLGAAVKRLEKHRQGLERYGNKFKFAARAEKIEMLFVLVISAACWGVTGLGWVEVIIIAHGPRWSPLARLFLFSFFFPPRVWLHIHRHSRTFTHLQRVYFLVQFLHIYCAISINSAVTRNSRSKNAEM